MFYCIKVNGKFQKSGGYVYGYKTIKEAIKMVDICCGLDSLLKDVEIEEVNKNISELASKNIQCIIKEGGNE